MGQVETSRLVTFETDKRELLAIMAGCGEYDRQTIYQGSVDGRYAVVPVDELIDSDTGDSLDGLDDAELLLQEMQIVGDTVDIPDDDNTEITLSKGNRASRVNGPAGDVRSTLDSGRVDTGQFFRSRGRGRRRETGRIFEQ
ncbi:hypothetical protein [Halomicrobium zhouii]|uniref:hypothetical protein n=1 Tax=Halomicrobium zhouii TaxID=767519 RepID=UPI000B7E527F|nr:hypothetical protein [Halomicrobium zhouii]